MLIHANYFNAYRSQIIASTLTMDANHIAIHSELAQRNFSRHEINIAEPFANAPLVLQFADGSHCEIRDMQEKDQVLKRLAYQTTVIERWQANWKIALLAIGVVMTFFFASYRYGGPWIAKQVVPFIPQAADLYLGREAQQALSRVYFTPSLTSDRQYTQAVMVFRRIKPTETRIPLTFDMQESKRIGPNALALPNGAIFVTDAMYNLLSKDGDKLSSDGEQELAGLLAHEIAHVELRHSMHNIVQTSLMTVVVGSMFGDFSSLATTAGSAVLAARYSQEKETEADEYAVQLLKSRGISLIHFAHLFESLEKYSSSKDGKKRGKLPNWFTDQVDDFLSSHPTNQRRIARIKQAEQE